VAPRNQEEADMDATTVAVDLAKNIFEVACANRGGRVVERKGLTRDQFERFLATLTGRTEVIMEACATAHYWGRQCQVHGLSVRLLPPQYVRPYVRRNKTDRADVDALLEAARCGHIPTVPVRTIEQQTLQAVHRVRTQWQTARVARINALRGLLREHGHTIPVVLRSAMRAAQRAAHRLTRLQQWAIATASHRGRNKATIALANKLAPIVWAVWRRDDTFHARPPLTAAT
jgi:transposase